jgi:hypothetical protein
MDLDIAGQILDELFPSLEALETQSTAILQFMKAKGLAADEELAPYMEQAGNAANVRWRAARIRVMSLLASAIRNAEEAQARADEQAEETAAEPQREANQLKTEQHPEGTEPRIEKATGAPTEKSANIANDPKETAQTKPGEQDAA